MSVYTKRGDKGITDMARTKNVSKSDDRIQLVGAIDELNSHIGLVKCMLKWEETVKMLSSIQDNLDLIAAGVEDPYSRDFKVNEEIVDNLEKETDRLEELCGQQAGKKVSGQNRTAAEINVTRAVARRTERCLAQVAVKFGADTESKKYLNRLSDYLSLLAKYVELSDALGLTEDQNVEKQNIKKQDVEKQKVKTQNTISEISNGIDEKVVREVLAQMGIQSRITLKKAKALIEKIEEESTRRGMNSVIAICGPEGNPIAVHVMDGAYLVSYDVAVKKAYTSVAVKMSTREQDCSRNKRNPGGSQKNGTVSGTGCCEIWSRYGKQEISEQIIRLFIPSCEICGVIRCPGTDRGSKCGETKYKKAGCGKTESENAEYNFRDKQWD